MLEIVKSKTINYQKLKIEDIKILEHINSCCKLYNNNYRPIYHIERLILLIHENIH